MTIEIWKPIPGWESLYEVSDLGNVRSLDRVTGARNGKTRITRGCVLKPVIRNSYYTFIAKREGRQAILRIHRCMLMAFSPAEGCERLDGCHRNGDRLDNRLDNLRWDTRAGNLRDMDEHGTRIRGASHPNSKVTPDQVRAIRASGSTIKALAAAHGVSINCIARIRHRITWSHVA